MAFEMTNLVGAEFPLFAFSHCRDVVAAASRDTVRSKYRTGKFSRQLRSAWHDAWETQGVPAALPMPLMGVLVEPVLQQINRAASKGSPQARELVTYFVGQGRRIDRRRQIGDPGRSRFQGRLCGSHEYRDGVE